MDFTGKRLLILAGAGVHNKVVLAAKEMGIYTIVTDNIANSPAKKIADESWMYSITDIDAIVERCKTEPVDGVVNFCIDPGQKPYLQICTSLGLPCYANADQLAIFTDKRRFKEYCAAHNVDVIPEYTIEDIQNGKAEYPVFIKPTDSRGSRVQIPSSSRSDLDNDLHQSPSPRSLSPSFGSDLSFKISSDFSITAGILIPIRAAFSAILRTSLIQNEIITASRM